MEEPGKADAALVVRSVNSLQWLYTIVLSLAITEAIKAVVTISQSSIISSSFDLLPMFFALIITLIPFHQGMNTYLDATYIRQETEFYALAGLIDFLFFFSEAVIFYVMALLLKQPKSFFTWLLILYIVDVIWIGVVYLSNRPGFKGVRLWGLINACTAIIFYLILYTPLLNDDIKKWILLTGVSLIRTISDYAVVWPFYWPYRKASQNKPAPANP